MIKERIYDGFKIFDIDSNGDNYESFKIGMRFFEEKGVLNSKYRGGFDTERFYFEYFDISSELTYSGFLGTELRISMKYSESDISRVRQWAEEIYNFIHNIENS
jgi:hypothetical protein